MLGRLQARMQNYIITTKSMERRRNDGKGLGSWNYKSYDDDEETSLRRYSETPTRTSSTQLHPPHNINTYPSHGLLFTIRYDTQNIFSHQLKSPSPQHRHFSIWISTCSSHRGLNMQATQAHHHSQAATTPQPPSIGGPPHIRPFWCFNDVIGA